MENLKFSMIVDKFKEAERNKRKKVFTETLMNYLHIVYDENHMLGVNDLKEKLMNDYSACLNAAGSLREEMKMGKIIKESSLRHNIYMWLAEDEQDCIPSRASTIEIAFALNPLTKYDGEKMANDLLQAAGYPKLHSASEKEVFFIYAFIKKMSYADCLKLLKDYLCYKESCEIPADYIEQTDKTTTYFYHLLLAVVNSEDIFVFFDQVYRMSEAFGRVSKKMTQRFQFLFQETKKMRGLKTDAEVIIDFYYYFKKTPRLIENFFRYEYPRTVIKTKNGQQREIIDDDDELIGFKVNPKTVYENMKNVLKGKTMLCREAYICWLVYCGMNIEDINLTIQKRYATLDASVYFDRFVMMICGFELDDNGQILFYDEMNQFEGQIYKVIPDLGELKHENNELLRSSLIRFFAPLYDHEQMSRSDFAGLKNASF